VHRQDSNNEEPTEGVVVGKSKSRQRGRFETQDSQVPLKISNLRRGLPATLPISDLDKVD
jgi:hypothetical protein